MIFFSDDAAKFRRDAEDLRADAEEKIPTSV